jgi:hypothetical protein
VSKEVFYISSPYLNFLSLFPNLSIRLQYQLHTTLLLHLDLPITSRHRTIAMSQYTSLSHSQLIQLLVQKDTDHAAALAKAASEYRGVKDDFLLEELENNFLKDQLAEAKSAIEKQRQIVLQYEREKADEALEDTDGKSDGSDAGSDSDPGDLYAIDHFILRHDQSEGLCKEIKRLQASHYR